MSFEKEFQHLHIPLKDIKLATNDFGNDHWIDQGGFGKVYKGELLLSCGLTMVAIKRLDSRFGQGVLEFWKEIMMLSQYNHENIVSLLGFCNESGENILVYEYLSNKSLDLYIKSTNLSWKQRLHICIGAASGLQYLHDPNGTQQRVLHRDIKSANILLDQNWNAKISDFGLSKIGPANQQYTFLASNAVGTFGYCDPLYRKTGYLTKESDIYSFGVVLFEVLCGRFCIEDYEDDRRFLEVLAQRCYQEKKVDTIIKSDLKGQISQECLERFSTIAYQCLQEDRTKRPLIAEIVKELQIALQYQFQRIVSHIRWLVKSIDLHPTEPWVLLGSKYDQKVYIWNFHSHVMEKSFGFAESFEYTAKFIAQKKWIVVGGNDGFIRAYNYETMESVVQLQAHTNYIRSLVVHPSLPYILSVSSDRLIKLWNWENDWECIQTFEGHTSLVMQVAFNPRDTNIFASASLDCTIKTWNIGYSSPRSSIEAHDAGLNYVEFLNTDEKLYLASGSPSSPTVKVWDYETGTCVQTLQGHTYGVTSILCVHSDVGYIITGSDDGTVRVWNAKTYDLEHEFTSELGEVRTIRFQKDSSQIILGCEEGVVIGQLISTTLENVPQPPHTTLEETSNITTERHP